MALTSRPIIPMTGLTSYNVYDAKQMAENPHIKFINRDRGYVRNVITPTEGPPTSAPSTSSPGPEPR